MNLFSFYKLSTSYYLARKVENSGKICQCEGIYNLRYSCTDNRRAIAKQIAASIPTLVIVGIVGFI
jgi:hypothetical protein